ncbi:MAG: hypothetical protein QXM31_00865 [Candidatus Woesearchaeota archaeon]
MGLLRRLFGKKEEMPEFDLGKHPGLEAGPGLGMPPGLGPSAGITEMPPEAGMPVLEDIGTAPPAPYPGMPDALATDQPGRNLALGKPAPSAFSPQPSAPDTSREFQVVNAKLDTLKALLDSINAKLDRIEQKPREEEPIPLSVRRWR